MTKLISRDILFIDIHLNVHLLSFLKVKCFMSFQILITLTGKYVWESHFKIKKNSVCTARGTEMITSALIYLNELDINWTIRYLCISRRRVLIFLNGVLAWGTVYFQTAFCYCVYTSKFECTASRTQRNLEREHGNVKFFWLNSWSISNANWQRMLFQDHLPSLPELSTTAIQLQLRVKASLLCCC